MSKPKHKLSRRDFLKIAGVSAVGIAGASCTAQTTPEAIPTEAITDLQPTPEAPPTEISLESQSAVSIVKARDYNPATLDSKVSELLDNLGGLDDVIKPGDIVALKVNLTGGTYFEPFLGVNPIESYVTHPEVTRALGKRLLDAGTGQLYIIEAQFDKASFFRWGYDDVATSLGATLIDLNDPDPYTDFAEVPVGKGWFIYQHFTLNRILSEVDVLISISKMKCHYSAGVTHSMKNLVGLTPVQHYRTSTDHWWRSALHGDDYGPSRLPRAIIDLNQACPIRFALVDGVKAAEGGEVPRGSFRPVEPGVLIAGKNPVANDAVATAVMGFDPTVERPTPPFLHGDNYLNLARDLGLGTNKLDEIEVVGEAIQDVQFEFAPSTTQSYNDDVTRRVM